MLASTSATICVSLEAATAKLAAVAIGKPYDYNEITVSNAVLQTYVGVYENEEGSQLLISINNGKLYTQQGRNPKIPVKAFKKDHFFFLIH